jgi:hypothetical protein
MNYPAAFYPLDSTNPRSKGGLAFVASDKFGANAEAVNVVLPVPSGDEFVVREVEGFRRALAGVTASLWRDRFVSSSDDWNTWFHLNAHNAKRMTLSFEKVIAIIGTLDKHDVRPTKISWRDEFVHASPQQLTFSKAGSEVPQARLPLQEDFTPSSELVSLWSECLKDLATAGGRKNIEFAFANASASERAHQFATMFRSTIGSYAQYLRYEGSGDGRILSNGRFAPAFQIALAQQFYIVLDKGAQFLELLSFDFISALENGWKVDADWGRLRLNDDNSIELILKPIEYFNDPDFIESEDVE